MPSENDSDTTYFHDWYKTNGKSLNKRRKDRYNSDPEYREKVLAQNREARRKRREASQGERDAKKDAQKVKPSKAWKSVNVEVDGKVVKMFTIGAVAKSLDCSAQALRLWERKGIIEETPYRYSKGDRLYTLEQIEDMRASLTAQGRIGPNKTRVKTSPYVECYILLAGRQRKKLVRLFRIGTMAQMVGRTVVTLEQLEQKGYLPETPFRLSEVGHRLYTLGMMESVKAAFDKRGGEVRGEGSWRSLHDEVVKSWSAQGIVGAQFLGERKDDE